MRTSREGDEIVLTVMEHHSNIVPWQLLARRTGATLRYVDISDDGVLDIDELRAHGRPAHEARRRDARFERARRRSTRSPISRPSPMPRAHCSLVDGAQSRAAHARRRGRSSAATSIAFSSHKMLGPTGVGVLWARAGLARSDGAVPGRRRDDLARPARQLDLGGRAAQVRSGHAEHRRRDRLRRGARLPRRSSAWSAVREHEMEITGLRDGRAAQRSTGSSSTGRHDVRRPWRRRSFALEGIHPHDVSTMVDPTASRSARATTARSSSCGGSGCRPPAARASPSTTTGRIDVLVEALHHAQRVFANDNARTAV